MMLNTIHRRITLVSNVTDDDENDDDNKDNADGRFFGEGECECFVQLTLIWYHAWHGL